MESGPGAGRRVGGRWSFNVTACFRSARRHELLRPIDSSALQHDNPRAVWRAVAVAESESTNPRHMDVYPSRSADSREHRVPALQEKSNACGDRQRSADAFR